MKIEEHSVDIDDIHFTGPAGKTLDVLYTICSSIDEILGLANITTSVPFSDFEKKILGYE